MSGQTEPADVLVIGAGIAGSICAAALEARGRTVRLLDKGRGPGGRLSTRRSAAGSFDHGAQYFTARDPRFVQRVDDWTRRGVVAAWDGRFAQERDGGLHPEAVRETRHVGVPGMNAPVRDLQGGLDVRFGARVVRLQRAGALWEATTDDGMVERGRVAIVTAPAPQAAALLDGVSPLAERLRDVGVAPCWATMLAFAEPLPLPFDGIRCSSGTLSWVARDSSRPGRAAGERWVLHSAPAWAQGVAGHDGESVARAMLASFARLLPVAVPAPVAMVAHRWLYALVTRPLGEDFLWDPQAALGVCGDACRGGRIEEAALSGLALADRLAPE